MENQEVKYYGLTFALYDPSIHNMDGANDFIRVVKVWEDKALSVHGSCIDFIESYAPKSLEEEGQEITREQFDEFYKKTVEKINKAATI